MSKLLKTTNIKHNLVKTTNKDKDKDKDNDTIINDDIQEQSLNNKDKDIIKHSNNKHSNNKHNDIYKNVILDEYIYLKAADLNYAIDDIILLKLKKKIEGTCIKIGYVIPDSIKIVTRSLGIINNANFDGITTYKLKYTADICNPVIGSIINCCIGNVDKSQIICYIDNADISPVEIYLYKQHHITNNDFLQLKVGDFINVKVCGSSWSYKDTRIISIAQYINTV